MRAINRRKRVHAKETGSFWLSFSDMMSVLVLVFIFVIFSMMLSLAEQTERLKKTEDQYTEAMIRMKQSEKELGEKEQLLIIQSEKLDELTKEMDAQAALLKEKEDELEKTLNENQIIIINLQSQLSDEIAENENLSQRIMMLESNKDAQQEEIDALIIAIEKQKKELDRLGVDYSRLLSYANQTESELKNTQSQLASAQNALSTSNQQLSIYENELERQQSIIEQMVGVKAQIIEALSDELERNNILVTVDAQTGAITLPSEMLFAVGQNTLSDRGMEYLDRFLPVYLNVLLSDEFSPYIAEIIIEGHTDSSGKAGYDAYLYNMQLSQQRALSVTNYVLKYDYMSYVLGLNFNEQELLRTLVTSSGRSFSALILNPDGTENKTASRRVEIKFRMKDDQSIGATEALLKGMN